MFRINRESLILIFLFLFLLAVVVVTPLLGSQPVRLGSVLAYLRDAENADGLIFFKIRLPRILLSIITGACLAIAGVVFQALLRNPLATPYTLGVSAGGTLGAVLMIKTGLGFSFLGFSTIHTSAFIGSLLTIFFVYYFSRSAKILSIHVMILAGVTISYFFAAIILLIHYFADFTETKNMIHWMMGGFDIVDIEIIYRSSPVILISILVLLFHARILNIISTSEETAHSKGVSVANVQKILFFTTSVITGLVVAISGPIGFVGLIVPHLLRLIIGVNHRYLLPASVLFGGAFLAICDTVARTILSPVDIPVGIVTAILGGPFFLWILFRQSKKIFA